MNPNFVHLRVHSEYSLADGIGRVKTLPAEARKLSMPAMAITDLMNFYGAVKFYRACVGEGIKPLIGLDVFLSGSDRSLTPDRLVLLCRNNQGFKFLNHVLTQAYTGPRHGVHLTLELEWLREARGNVIALSAGLDGELGRALVFGNEGDEGNVLDRYLSVFGEHFFIDVSRVGVERESDYIQSALDLAERRSVPAVATNPVQFLSADNFDAHDIRVCINEGRVLNDPRRVQRFTPQHYLRSPEEMQKLFPESPVLLDNSIEIAKQCNVFLDFKATHMPAFPSSSGVLTEDLLRSDAKSGLEKRLQQRQATGIGLDILPGEYETRLEHELGVIIHMGFAGYFLIVADFIRWARDNDIPVGPGRGSGAGSLVAWVIGITDLDPIAYGLLFERFLNPERVSLPDFDIDFCMDRRDEVIDYVSQRYGKDRVSQIITYGTMAARAVVRDVGRVMGHPYGFVDNLAKMVPFEIGITLEKALDAEPALKQRYEEEEEVRELIIAARLLEGLPRNVGKHAGGVVIAPDKISEFVSLYMEPGMPQPVTQFDKDDLESIGLVKFDFLGLRTLTVIHNTVKMINGTGGGTLDINSIALDDGPTFEFIKAGKTTGVFQLESRGMKEIVLRLLPDQFDELIALVALFRPGPLQSGMVDDFINRKHGREKIEYPHPDLEEILQPTYGVILYQEQVMQIAQVLSGYTLGSADLLRRAMGKKKPEEMARQRVTFVEGASCRGVDEDISGYIFDLVEKFAGYGFNKSHSAAYALLTYQTAWLKTHYPAEFMAASLTADMEHTDKVVTLISETRALDLVVHPPSINHCGTGFRPVRGEAVYYGLGALKGVGERAVDSIVAERESAGEYCDLFDFCDRIDGRRLNKRVVEALIRGGALDCLGETRASLVANLRAATEVAAKQAQDAESGQNDLFGVAPADSVVRQLHRLPEWSEQNRLGAEKDVLGLYLTGHPYDPLRAELLSLVDGDIVGLKPSAERNILVAGLVTQIRTMKTRRGDLIAFLTLDDNTARIEVSVLSRLFVARRNLIHPDAVLVIRGTTSVDDYTGSVQMRADELFDLSTIRTNWLQLMKVRLEYGEQVGESFRLLYSLLKKNEGNTRIEIEYQRDNGDRGMIRPGSDWRVLLDDSNKEMLETHLGTELINYSYDRAAVLAVQREEGAAAA